MTDTDKTIAPEVGMGCTMYVGSDSYAGTIVYVSASGKSFDFQVDYYQANESGEYTYTPNPNADVRTARLSRAKRYAGRFMCEKLSPVRVGVRGTYRDPSF